jgi:DNA-binding SARP family transcriptional activator/TolB-like protein
MHTLRVFGGASIEGDAGPLTGPVTQRHRLALLALLALSQPTGLSRDKLLAYLWPGRNTNSARNLLNQGIHVVRRALGEDAILSVGDELRLGPEAVRVDVLEFERSLEAGDPETAVDLYRGPLLDGFFLPDAGEFDLRVDVERIRLRDRYQRALAELARTATASKDGRAAAGWWRRLAAEDPYNSQVALELMKVLEAVGARADAIRHARVHATLMSQEFGAEPDPAVEALAERIRANPASTGTLSETGDEATSAGEAAPTPEVEAGPPDRTDAAPGSASLRRRFRSRRLGVSGGILLLGTAGWALANVLSSDTSDVERIAVLPLANLTGDPQQEFYVSGMHEALILELGRITDLTVISRQSVLRYQNSNVPLPVIARELAVDALVEGGVFLVGDSVRITAQLVRANPEGHLWAEAYRGGVGEALALQSEVARAIAGAVQARMRPEARGQRSGGRAVDPGAQEAFLRGLYHLERQALGTLSAQEADEAREAAIVHLEEAVAMDPDWAAAHARLSVAYHWQASAAPEREAELYPKAKAAAVRALELDEEDAQAHASLGFIRFFFEWDWDGAERAYQRALALDPSAHQGGYALYLRAAGRYDEAVEHFRRAEVRNPLSRALKRQVVVAYFCAGRYDEALRQAEQVTDFWPEGEAVARYGLLGNAYGAQSMHADAIAAFEEAVALSDSATWAVQGLAHAQARAGARAEALALLDWLESERPDSYHPVLHVALGQTERGAASVVSAFERTGLRALWDLRCFPEWEVLAREPPIRAILERVGLAR